MDKDLRPVLLLDFDDVLCINRPYGGFDAKLALSQFEGVPVDRPESPPDLWTKLFDTTAKELLARIDSEFHPWYVLTTSWWWHFTYEEFVDILSRCGLDFIRRNLHSNWAPPKASRPAARWAEVEKWIETNPACSQLWVVLDDELSGTGLRERHREHEAPFIVLCREGVGLTVLEYAKVRAGFVRRLSQT